MTLNEVGNASIHCLFTHITRLLVLEEEDGAGSIGAQDITAIVEVSPAQRHNQSLLVGEDFGQGRGIDRRLECIHSQGPWPLISGSTFGFLLGLEFKEAIKDSQCLCLRLRSRLGNQGHVGSGGQGSAEPFVATVDAVRRVPGLYDDVDIGDE